MVDATALAHLVTRSSHLLHTRSDNRRATMRGSIVVLALAITPLFASVSQAQHGHGPHWQRRWTPAARRDDDRRGKSDDKKCEDRQRGNPSDNGLNHRADPRTKGNKECDVGGSSHTPTHRPPPPAADTASQ